MSARMRRNEHASQENVGTQSLQSAKDKDKEKGIQSTVTTATAATAAVKLERYAHTPDHTPTKGVSSLKLKCRWTGRAKDT